MTFAVMERSGKEQKMDKAKVYCDECTFLEERPVKAEVQMDSGNYIVTGTRFYCSKHQKWWSLNTTLELVGYSSCVYGERKEE